MGLMNCNRSTTSNLILLTILCGSLLSIYRSGVYIDEDSKLESPFPWSTAGLAREQSERSSRVNPAYTSSAVIYWGEISSVVREIKDDDGIETIGLLNFDGDEIGRWENLILDAERVRLQLEHVQGNITWETLYPERIDEEEGEEEEEEEEKVVPKCPDMPSVHNPSGNVGDTDERNEQQ